MKSSCALGGELNCGRKRGKQRGASSQNVNIHKPYNPVISLLGSDPEKKSYFKITLAILFLGAA